MQAELTATGMVGRPGRSVVGLVLTAVRSAVLSYVAGTAGVAPALVGTLPPQTQQLLRGRGIVGGRATGPARLVRNECDMESFAAGDVLVAEYGSIAVLACLPLAAAVVLTYGGALSAAAIDARELGIPAVFGLPTATSEIGSGAWLTVDGERGTVTMTAGW